jgi:hypothetical protein
VDAAGRLVVPGPPTSADTASIIFGSRTAKGRLISIPTLDWAGFTCNGYYDGTAWFEDDTAKPRWAVNVRSDASDNFTVSRQPPGNGAGVTVLAVDAAGNMSITGRFSGGSLYNDSVQRAMLAGGAAANGPGIVLATGVKAFNSGSTYNTWILVETLPNITTRGGPVLLVANHGLSHVSLTTTAAAMSFRWLRSGATIYNDFGTKAGQTGYLPLPSSLQLDVPPAGTYSYTFWVYLASGASSSLINDSGFNRLYQAIEIG